MTFIKKLIRFEIAFVIIAVITMTIASCIEHASEKSKASSMVNFSKSEPKKSATTLSEDFKNYWYAGEAELTSYKLEQARYGELHSGTATLIFVTEDFLPDVQVKADRSSDKNIPVLKLNATKKFNTGIYPYSIMQSTFYPVANYQHAIKVTSSIQEWCGQVYAQLNNRDDFEVMSHSYFQGEADQNYTLDKAILENELWTQLRIDPKSLPTGDLTIIPSLEYTRLKHTPIKAYKAKATLAEGTYTIDYPELKRSLKIMFTSEFPHDITGWEESISSGYGANATTLTTKATKLKTLKTAYWRQNSNADEVLRQELQLD